MIERTKTKTKKIIKQSRNYINTKVKKIKGFSIMEIAMVLLIVAVVFAGIVQSSRLVEKSKFETARTITKASPASSFQSLELWLETTTEESFPKVLASEETVTQWNDINSVQVAKHNASASSSDAPTYVKSCLASLPCIRFDANKFLDTDDLKVSTTQLSIFLVLAPKTLPTSSDASIISTQGQYSSLNNSLKILLKSGADVGKIEYASPNLTGTFMTSSAIQEGVATIVSIIDNGDRVRFFLNKQQSGGTFSAQNAVKALGILNIASYNDGSTRNSFYDGDILEVIIFSQALKNSDREYVEGYLEKKWNFRF